MIRFVIWATLKDWRGWRPTEVIVHNSNYLRWKSMKAAYEKDYSVGAALKEGFVGVTEDFVEWEEKQSQKEEQEMKGQYSISRLSTEMDFTNEPKGEFITTEGPTAEIIIRLDVGFQPGSDNTLARRKLNGLLEEIEQIVKSKALEADE